MRWKVVLKGFLNSCEADHLSSDLYEPFKTAGYHERSGLKSSDVARVIVASSVDLDEGIEFWIKIPWKYAWTVDED